MRFAGIDIGSEKHFVAVVDEDGATLLRASGFEESAEGYSWLDASLGAHEDLLVGMEATGHYWQNLYAHLVERGIAVVLLNPLRTRRFAESELQRAKTDAIDALSIAKLIQQKRPLPNKLGDQATSELRELVRLRDRLVQDLGDRVRQLHRIVDLGFPEFTRYVRDLSSETATAILSNYPTAQYVAKARLKSLAGLGYGRGRVGTELAEQLIAAAKASVGAHHGPAYVMQAKYACEDIRTLRERIKTLDADISTTLDKHDVGRLLTTIDGIGDNTAARLISELGDIAAFKSADALAAYVGVTPRTNHSGKRTPSRAPISRLGHAKLRAKLWMPVLNAVRRNGWLAAFYARLRAAGKPAMVALVAALRKLLHAVYSVAKNRKPFELRLTGPAVTTTEVR